MGREEEKVTHSAFHRSLESSVPNRFISLINLILHAEAWEAKRAWRGC